MFEHRRDNTTELERAAGTQKSGGLTRKAISRRLKRLEDRYIPRETGESRRIRELLRQARERSERTSGKPLSGTRCCRLTITRIPGLSVRVRADICSHAIHGQDAEAVRRWEEYLHRNRPAKSEN